MPKVAKLLQDSFLELFMRSESPSLSGHVSYCCCRPYPSPVDTSFCTCRRCLLPLCMVTSYKTPNLHLEGPRRYQHSGRIGRIRHEGRCLQMLRVICTDHRELRSLRDYHLTRTYPPQISRYQQNPLKHAIRQKHSQRKVYLRQIHYRMGRWKTASDNMEGRKIQGIP